MRGWNAVTAAIAVTLSVTLGGGALAAAPIDQQQTDGAGGVAFLCDDALAQVFVANVTGELTRIDVLVTRGMVDSGDLRVRLRKITDHGLPANRTLATATIDKDDIAGWHAIGWRPVRFDPPARVIAGWWYAITLDAPDCVPPDDGGFGWAFGPGDPYLRGDAAVAPTAAGPWTWAERDHAFKTHVRPSSPVFQPDVAVAPKGGSTWVGADLYDWDGWTERIEAAVDAGVPTTWLVRIQNGGSRTDTFRLLGTGSGDGFTVRWLKGRTGTTGITARIVAGTYQVGPLKPGAAVVIRAVVTPGAGLPTDAETKVVLRASSLTKPSHMDGIHVFLRVD